MKFRLRTHFAVSIALIGSTLTLNAQLKTDYDHSVTFSSYKTYSWIKVQASNSIWGDRIKQAVDAQLAAKGWTMVDSGADASISAFRSVKSEQTLQTFYDGMGGGWRWRGIGGEGFSTTTTETTKVGVLVVDIFDSHTQKLVWRGTDMDALSSSPENNAKKLNKDLANMFKRFPPAR